MFLTVKFWGCGKIFVILSKSFLTIGETGAIIFKPDDTGPERILEIAGCHGRRENHV